MLTILCYLNPEWQPGDGGRHPRTLGKFMRCFIACSSMLFLSCFIQFRFARTVLSLTQKVGKFNHHKPINHRFQVFQLAEDQLWRNLPLCQGSYECSTHPRSLLHRCSGRLNLELTFGSRSGTVLNPAVVSRYLFST